MYCLANLFNVAGCFFQSAAAAFIFEPIRTMTLSLESIWNALDPNNCKPSQRDQVVLLPASLFCHLLARLITKLNWANSTDLLFDLEALNITILQARCYRQVPVVFWNSKISTNTIEILFMRHHFISLQCCCMLQNVWTRILLTRSGLPFPEYFAHPMHLFKPTRGQIFGICIGCSLHICVWRQLFFLTHAILFDLCWILNPAPSRRFTRLYLIQTTRCLSQGLGLMNFLQLYDSPGTFWVDVWFALLSFVYCCRWAFHWSAWSRPIACPDPACPDPWRRPGHFVRHALRTLRVPGAQQYWTCYEALWRSTAVNDNLVARVDMDEDGDGVDWVPSREVPHVSVLVSSFSRLTDNVN
jgi:hypothetical protein